MALMVVLLVMAVATALVVSVLDTEMIQYASLRNTMDYERASYLAGSACHHALAELEKDSAWRDGISSTEFPSGSGNTYSATAVTSGSDILITGTGTSGSVTRTLQVTVSIGS